MIMKLFLTPIVFKENFQITFLKGKSIGQKKKKKKKIKPFILYYSWDKIKLKSPLVYQMGEGEYTIIEYYLH